MIFLPFDVRHIFLDLNSKKLWLNINNQSMYYMNIKSNSLTPYLITIYYIIITLLIIFFTGCQFIVKWIIWRNGTKDKDQYFFDFCWIDNTRYFLCLTPVWGTHLQRLNPSINLVLLFFMSNLRGALSGALTCKHNYLGSLSSSHRREAVQVRSLSQGVQPKGHSWQTYQVRVSRFYRWFKHVRIVLSISNTVWWFLKQLRYNLESVATPIIIIGKSVCLIST